MMMHMPWVLVLLIAFLTICVVGSLIAVRVLGARTVGRDHPR